MNRRLCARAVFGAALVAAYLRYLRPRVLEWGATADEAHRAMPADDVLPGASLQTSRAISIDAPLEVVWPWLAQMGPHPRAGAYTYDWVERLLGIDIENSDRLLPQFQHLEPGEVIGLNEKGEGLRVLDVQPGRSLALQWVPAGSTWTFGLYPEPGGGTRLVSRNRLQGKGPLFWLGMAGFMEWASLIMERKMLHGIKERAERLQAERANDEAGLLTSSAPGDAC